MGRPKNVFRGIAMALIAGLAVAVGTTYLRGGSASTPELQYTTARVTRGEIVRSVGTVGQLSPSVSVEVSSQISGLVTEVHVDFNSVVKQGQILARIDPSTYQQRLRQAEADLEAARSSHELVTINTQRLKALREEDLITQQEYDAIEAQLESSRAGLITRRAAVENARVDLERCNIRSPIDGIVIFRQIEVGKTVVSSMSAPTLFTIARSLSKMRIIAPVSEVDVALVQPEQPVAFTIDAFPGRTFEGRVMQIRNPYVPSDDQSGQQKQSNEIAAFDAIIEVDNREGMLRPSLTANVLIIVERRESALRIPNGALRFQPQGLLSGQTANTNSADENAVTVFRPVGSGADFRLEPVRIRLGMSDSHATEVVNGLSEGDSVVTGSLAPPAQTKPRGLLF
jgi:HlyD family secretion protein